MTALGKFLKDWRTLHDVTIQVMATSVGVTISMISVIENGKAPMSDALMAKVADFMNLSKRERDELRILRNASRDVWKIDMTHFTETGRESLARYVEKLIAKVKDDADTN